MKTSELAALSLAQADAKLVKLDKIIATHPQRSMRAKAGGTKRVILGELQRRLNANTAV